MSVGEQLFNAAEKGSETTVRELLKRATLNDVRWRNEVSQDLFINLLSCGSQCTCMLNKLLC